MENLIIRRLKKEESEAAEKLTIKIHEAGNPPFVNLNIKFDDIQLDDTIIDKMINAGFSYGAFNGDNLVAVLFGYIRHRDVPNIIIARPEQKMTTHDAVNVMHYLAKLDEMARMIEHEADMFTRYNVDQALHFYGLSVSDKYKRQGLGLKLTEHAMTDAINQGVTCFFTRSTGVFSAKIFDKLGFEKLSEMRYDKFIGPDGKPVFRPPEPHYAMIMFAKRIV